MSGVSGVQGVEKLVFCKGRVQGFPPGRPVGGTSRLLVWSKELGEMLLILSNYNHQEDLSSKWAKVDIHIVRSAKSCRHHILS
jgi:hypothetical protein